MVYKWILPHEPNPLRNALNIQRFDMTMAVATTMMMTSTPMPLTKINNIIQYYFIYYLFVYFDLCSLIRLQHFIFSFMWSKQKIIWYQNWCNKTWNLFTSRKFENNKKKIGTFRCLQNPSGLAITKKKDRNHHPEIVSTNKCSKQIYMLTHGRYSIDGQHFFWIFFFFVFCLFSI